MTCPLQCAARGNFWGGANDTDVHDLQTPTATQTSFDETHTTSASVSTTANTSEKRKIKKHQRYPVIKITDTSMKQLREFVK